MWRQWRCERRVIGDGYGRGDTTGGFVLMKRVLMRESRTFRGMEGNYGAEPPNALRGRGAKQGEPRTLAYRQVRSWGWG